MTRRVLVVGDVMLDVVVQSLAPIAPTSDSPARTRVGRGGSAANLAVALRAQASENLEVVFVGVAGSDAAAHVVETDLAQCGVVAHLSHVVGSTGVVVSLVAHGGQRAMLTDRGVNSLLTYEHVAPWLDATLAHVHVSGYTVLDEHTRTVATRILDAAAALGATSSVDVCSVAPLASIGAATFAAAVRAATMLFANEEEAMLLAGQSDGVAALEELSRDWREVVVTRGARGALARSGEVSVQARAQGGHVVDTTGAGDSATGTYLARRLAGDDPAESLERAMFAAAQVVGGLGSRG